MVTVVMNQSGQKLSYLLFAGGFMTEVAIPGACHPDAGILIIVSPDCQF